MTGTLTLTPAFTTAWSLGAPAGASLCATQVCTDIQALIQPSGSFSQTHTITFDWGTPPNGGLAGSLFSYGAQTYTTIRNAYLAVASPNALQAVAYTTANIPSSNMFTAVNPSAVTNVHASLASGLGIANFSVNASTVTLLTSAPYDTNLHGTSCTASSYSMYSLIWHEVTECLGRFMSSGIWDNNVYLPGDWWTFSFSTARNFTNSGSRALSADGSTSVGGNVFIFNMSQNAGDQGDVADFGSGSAFNTTDTVGYIDPIGTVPPPGGTNAVGQTYAEVIAKDLQYMTLIGWALTTAGLAQANLGAAIPTNSSLPVASGGLWRGNTLSVTDGTWTNTPSSFSYQWRSGGSNVGTNVALYVSTTADVGNTIDCVVTATNGSGFGTATAAAVGPIALGTFGGAQFRR